MQKPILLFDPECPLCLRFSQALKLVDVKETIEIRSIYEEQIYLEFSNLTKEECEAMVHLVKSNDEILRGPEVLEFLLETLPAVNKFAWLLDNESSKKAIDAFYRKVNDIRKHIKNNGCSSCGNSRRREL